MTEMTLAHDIQPLDAGAEPVLEDGEQRFVGKEAIERHLESLAKYKQEWEKFQTDACYCDDEGNVI